jgi:hypothetical protein
LAGGRRRSRPTRLALSDLEELGAGKAVKLGAVSHPAISASGIVPDRDRKRSQVFEDGEEANCDGRLVVVKMSVVSQN